MSVWVAAIRSGLVYHQYDPMHRRTPCGRWHTGEKGMVRGHVVGLEVAQEKNMTACARCYGTGEVIQPGKPEVLMNLATAPRVIGLDLSLTSTGVASNAGWVDRIRIGADKSPGGFTRLREIRTRVLEFGRADLVVVEGLAISRQTGQHLTRAGLWHLVMEAIDSRGTSWVTVGPTSLKKYATGKGNAGKDEVLAAVIRRFPDVDVKGNDEADALVLAAMGSDHLGHPMVDMPAAHRAALDKVAWPEVNT